MRCSDPRLGAGIAIHAPPGPVLPPRRAWPVRHSMRAIASIMLALLVWTTGCSSQRRPGSSAVAREHPIVQTLAARDRNAVHVALWTLQQNGISNPPAVSFEASYSEAQPKIQAVRDFLETLPDERLTTLDRSLAYHWQVYSPIWNSHDWP